MVQEPEQSERSRSLVRKLGGGVLVGLGYWLSPLSWWNDLVFNFPIAYAFGWVVDQVHGGWLWPGTVVGYWLSNVAGMILMQVGAVEVLSTSPERSWRRQLWWGVGGSTVYTVAIAALAYCHVLELPDFLHP